MASKVHFRSVLTRGLNIQGQLGIRNRYNPIVDFTPIPELQSLDIDQIISDNSQNLAVVNQRYQVLYWGWPLCTRTTYRFLEHYEIIPRVVKMLQTFTPVFGAGKDRPVLETEFAHQIEQIDMGCGYISAIDTKNNVWSWGDNYAGQLGLQDDIHRETPAINKELAEIRVKQMSLGFQHQIFLSDEGHCYGIGKNNRFQMSKNQNRDSHGEMFDRYAAATKITHAVGEEQSQPYFDGERIKQVACGKFHSLFLTDSGRVFAVGFNKYGQLGVANSLYMHAEEPIEVFTDGVEVKEIRAGWHHNLLLGTDGNLYGFGARMNGQMDGKNLDGREEQCSITQIRLPGLSKSLIIHSRLPGDNLADRSPIKSLNARNLRSQVMLENGEVWFWGGYFFEGYNKLFIDGFNMLNEEEGIPHDKPIIQHEMGFGHDTVLLQEAPSAEVVEFNQEYV